jgi:hypothetical protein
MKAFLENAKPSLETLMDRSDWGIVMIPGHYRGLCNRAGQS